MTFREREVLRDRIGAAPAGVGICVSIDYLAWLLDQADKADALQAAIEEHCSKLWVERCAADLLAVLDDV